MLIVLTNSDTVDIVEFDQNLVYEKIVSSVCDFGGKGKQFYERFF